MSCFEASIYSLGGDVSARASKGIPIPACPIDSRETRDIQTSMSISVQPSCKTLARVSSSWPRSVSICVLSRGTYTTRDIPEDRHHHAHTLYREDSVENAPLLLMRHA